MEDFDIPQDRLAESAERVVDRALDEARRRTVAFAKRQERWFRRDLRIQWIDVADHSAKSVEVVTSLLARWML